MKHKTKKPIVCRFSDLFRRKSFYKPNLAPAASTLQKFSNVMLVVPLCPSEYPRN
jgi:hypothetical protein